MAFIDSKKVVCLDVAYEISAENDARPDFSLEANIHLHRTRSTKVGIVRAKPAKPAKPDTLLQQASKISWSGCIQIAGIVRLVLFLECGNLAAYSSDGNRSSCRSAAERRLQRRPSGNRHRQRRSSCCAG